MDVEMLRVQLTECERTILELTYLFSETLENQRLMLNYKDKVIAQADQERAYFLSIKMPLPRWAKQHLNALDKGIRQSNRDLATISCNIQSCRLFKDNLEFKLNRALEDA